MNSIHKPVKYIIRTLEYIPAASEISLKLYFYRLMNESYCGMAYNDEVRLNTGLVYPECPPDVIIMQKNIRQ